MPSIELDELPLELWSYLSLLVGMIPKLVSSSSSSDVWSICVTSPPIIPPFLALSSDLFLMFGEPELTSLPALSWADIPVEMPLYKSALAWIMLLSLSSIFFWFLE